MRYAPATVPTKPTPEDLANYLRSELRKIGDVIANIDQGRQDVLHVLPDKPRGGQIVYADGTKWDPGHGEGLYYWRVLGGWEKIAPYDSVVLTFNTRSGNVTLTSGDVTGALTYTPLDAASYTAADVLTKIKTVDGAGSGLDADLLDAHDSSFFLAASSYTAADVLAKIKTVDGAGSGLDADTVDGYNPDQTVVGNTIAVRNSSGYLFALYYNQSSTPEVAVVVNVITDNGDGYHRRVPIANFMASVITRTSSNPTPIPGSGAFGSVSASVLVEHIVGTHFNFVTATINITNNGSAAGYIQLPIGITAALETTLVGRAAAVTGKMVQAIAPVTGNYLQILAYDNTYPGVTGERITVTGLVYT